MCSVGLFVYQSLDAIDGKQARRTGSSSPLGELFDHGCDSVSTVFVTMAICATLKLGAYPWLMFALCLLLFAAFYTAHWQTYVTGTLRFGLIDATEAQFCMYSIHFITAISGDYLWSQTVCSSSFACFIHSLFGFFGGQSELIIETVCVCTQVANTEH